MRHENGFQNVETCCLDISLGNRYQQGEYLENIVSWVNNRKFARCLVSLGDTLHRHNLRQSHPDMDSARRACLEKGDAWIESARSALGKLEMPFEIMRSDMWLAHPDFWKVHEALRGLVNSDSGFKAAIFEDIEAFVARQKALPRTVAEANSMAYLLEECAADILLGRQEPVVHLYPGAWHRCYFYLMENADRIPDILRGLESGIFKRIYPEKRKRKDEPPTESRAA